MFSIICHGRHGRHGDSVNADDPKLAAYKQAAYDRQLGLDCTLIQHDDGSYTVAWRACARCSRWARRAACNNSGQTWRGLFRLCSLPGLPQPGSGRSTRRFRTY